MGCMAALEAERWLAAQADAESRRLSAAQPRDRESRRGLGQAAHISCGGGGGLLHPCRRDPGPEPVGGEPAGERRSRHDLEVPLFHRHARGLILTEQGEMLYRTVREVMLKLDAARTRLSDSREKPHGELRVTTTVGIGTNWLTPRLGEFMDLYPDIKLRVILSDDELDLSMREADVAIRMREPVQPDLIRRKLFTMHFHAYASPDYLASATASRARSTISIATASGLWRGDRSSFLNNHQFAALDAGRDAEEARAPAMTVNNITALMQARWRTASASPCCRTISSARIPASCGSCRRPTCPNSIAISSSRGDESVARVQAFRDFLVSKAQRWQF
jgi:DNA-binding transcriptional LysR family regulator